MADEEPERDTGALEDADDRAEEFRQDAKEIMDDDDEE